MLREGVNFFFIIPSISYVRTFSFSFSLPRRNSYPGSLRRLSSPLPTKVRAFILVARRLQAFFHSSTRIELRLPTLLGALSSLFLFLCEGVI